MRTAEKQRSSLGDQLMACVEIAASVLHMTNRPARLVSLADLHNLGWAASALTLQRCPGWQVVHRRLPEIWLCPKGLVTLSIVFMTS